MSKDETIQRQNRAGIEETILASAGVANVTECMR